MTGFCKKTICLFLTLLCLISLSVPALADSGKTIVYRTKTGECYHRDGCRYLRSKIQITLDEAVNKYNLRPCSYCNPPTLDSRSQSPSSAPSLSGGSSTSSGRPDNGEVLYSKNKTKPSTLTFENNTEYDCLVSLVNKSDTEVLQFYVRKNKDATVDIPTGKFTIKIAYGSTWKNTEDLFGKNTAYAYSDGELDVVKGEAWTFTFK